MKGLVIACPTKYQDICLKNIELLRNTYHCNLPIEIWEIGNEINVEIKNKMKMMNEIIFKNMNDYCDNPNHWKGFQVKVFAMYHCGFDEIILCDADVTFFRNPEIIFEDSNYQRTGAYFFKDLDQWQFTNLSYANKSKFNSLDFFNKRKQFIHNLVPTITSIFPKEWSYLYDTNIPSIPVKEALQESGVVYMNKHIHKESLDHIFQLNNHHLETYKYVWGDKETFWIGCVMANQDYYFNPVSGYMYNNCLTHDYDNSIFWKQK
jgi:hypothetical protein